VKLKEAIKTEKFSSLKQKAELNIMYVGYLIKKRGSDTLKDFGLTAEQFNVLRILKGSHPEALCVRDIASRMIEKNSNVPRIIDRLEVKKLAKRNVSNTDKRETAISITKAGINILEMANPVMKKKEESLCKLSEKELLQLNDLLDRFFTK
jgi:DNA-binding MarR family transcriptional regulator